MGVTDNNQIYNSNIYYNDAQVEAGQILFPISDEAILSGHPDHIPSILSESERDELYYSGNTYQ